MPNELNNSDNDGDGISVEHVIQILRKMTLDFRSIQIERAPALATEMIAVIKREFGVDVLQHTPNAEALLAEFYRKSANDLFDKISAKTEQRLGFKI